MGPGTNKGPEPAFEIILVLAFDGYNFVFPVKRFGFSFIRPLWFSGFDGCHLAREWILDLAPDRFGQGWPPARKTIREFLGVADEESGVNSHKKSPCGRVSRDCFQPLY